MKVEDVAEFGVGADKLKRESKGTEDFEVTAGACSLGIEVATGALEEFMKPNPLEGAKLLVSLVSTLLVSFKLISAKISAVVSDDFSTVTLVFFWVKPPKKFPSSSDEVGAAIGAPLIKPSFSDDVERGALSGESKSNKFSSGALAFGVGFDMAAAVIPNNFKTFDAGSRTASFA